MNLEGEQEGMAWIESHTEVERHRKTVLMAGELGMQSVHVSGHLHALWHNVLEQQEDGDLTNWPDTLIARMAMYEADAEGCKNFVDLLRKHGFLDGNILHDWLDYAGRFLIWKYGRRHRKRLVDVWLKHGKRYGIRTGQIHDNVQQMSSKCRTQPTTRVGMVGLVGTGNNSSSGEGVEGDFATFWKAYPKRVGKKQTYAQWLVETRVSGVANRIIAAVQRQKDIRVARTVAKLFTPEWPDPVRYLKHHRWEDELEEPSGTNNRTSAEPGKYDKVKTLRIATNTAGKVS